MRITLHVVINGDAIAAARGRLRWSQQQLADKVGVSREAIARWEADGPIRRANYARLLDALQLSGPTEALSQYSAIELLTELNRRVDRGQDCG